jgi:hypothetical protein
MPLQEKPMLAPRAGSPPQHALVADAARDPIRVEALEQELSGAARDPEQVAKASQRDRAGSISFSEERAACPVVCPGADRESAPEPDDAPGALEVGGELGIVDPDSGRTSVG